MKAPAPTSDLMKLTLIRNNQVNGLTVIDSQGEEVALSKDAVKYLIRALEGADAEFTREIETVLTRVARKTPQLVLSELVKALNSPHRNVQSACTMVLIRIGQPTVSMVKEFYLRQLKKRQSLWVAEFILDQLGESLPSVMISPEEQTRISEFRPLEKVG